MMSKGAAMAVHAAMAKDPMNTYRSYVSLLEDSTARDESKVKAVQELSGDLETIVAHPQYPSFLEHALRIFLKVLHEGESHFIADHPVQQLRKLILEIIHRIPTDQNLKRHVKDILNLMFRLLQVENEENVLVCLRIIIELHKTFRPDFTLEIKNFLQFVKRIYRELPSHLNKIFEPRPALKIRDFNVTNLESILNETFTITTVQLESPDEPISQYNLIPRATLSLKVLAELPIIVVLMYQLYKQTVHHDVEEFIPLIMGTISLQPSEQHRTHPNFNREVFVDFMAAQIKTLSFLAYIVRIYQAVVNENSADLAKGMLALLRLCPQEVAHLRKELLIAARHILATDLRDKFVDCLDELFDENILIGSGWTAYESLRPLAYSTLADLVHHVRQKLSLKDLSKAVTVFSKIVHDESLVTTIQTMSCKLLLNLVDCIRTRSEEENGNGREIFMRMLEVFVLKFKTISKLQLPVLMAKYGKDSYGRMQTPQLTITQNLSSVTGHSIPASPVVPHPSVHATNIGASTSHEAKLETKDDVRPASFSVGGLSDGREDKPKFGFPTSQAANYSVTDCRSLVKTLVCGVKTITWGILVKKSSQDATLVQNKRFQPKETLVLIRLIKYAFQALDVYTLSVPAAGQSHPRAHSVQAARSKEEKDVLEHLAGVYTMIHPMTFKEVFSTTIDYMVDRINKNFALQIVANSFLTNCTISPIFATILVEYLLKRMEEMGSNVERSNLYLKLFKLVFGSVSLFPAENEQMLKPYLHQIVNRSMELALSAKEPYNYFLLLRALFRSIGGGSHDLLYQEFLPLLPNLLQGLNSLQSGLHKQHMKDLFVELCLTVPVRLSSLLPYLPMLMDPLVSALNGSQTLVSQGLRTLELCVDNLQPDFLYEHIQPVRAELMQALWRTLRNPNDSIAQVAFRVLGKFGGGNRKMMIEPQKLEYNARENVGPCITVHFPDDDFPDRQSTISLPVEKIIETAFNALKSSNTDTFYREQCWEIIKGFLAATIDQSKDELHSILKFFSHPDFNAEEIDPVQSPLYKCPDAESRKVLEMALTGMFVAVAIKDLRANVLPFMVGLVYHYTSLMVGQQCGIYVGGGRQVKFQGMDPLVLIDATAAIMGHEEKELCKPGKLALMLIIDTASIYLSSSLRASQLPFYEYLVEKMCSLCYERAWYAKHGGCVAIQSLMQRIPEKWVFSHMFTFLKALLFVMMDLTGEVSSGAVDLAKTNLEQLLTDFGIPIIRDGKNDDLVEAQTKAINEVVQELIRLLTSPNTCVREQAMHSLRVLARVSNKTVTQVIEPHRELLVEVIPPRKYLLRHKPVNSQIGLLDANTFCITLKPRLFTIDVSNPEHKIFFDELKSICEKEDSVLQKLYPCYKSVNLVPLRKAALRVLASCHHLESHKHEIYVLLYKALDSSDKELQEAGFDCMKQYISGCDLDVEMVCAQFRPLLLKLGDYRSLTLPVITQLDYLTRLFPKCFNEKLCEQLLAHLKECLQVAVAKSKERISVNDLKICSAIMNIFHQIPDATAKLIPSLIVLVLDTEIGLMLEAGSPFREPVVKFLSRYPQQTLELLLADPQLQGERSSRFLEYLLKGEKGKPFRDFLQQNPKILVNMALNALTVQSAITGPSTSAIVPDRQQTQLRYMTIRIVSLLVKYDDKWISEQHELVACLRKIWISKEFEERHLKVDSVDFTQWKEPKLLAKCLLNFVQHHEDDIELLFQLLRAFTGRFIPDFEFLRNFLENTVANNYPVKWKRLAFFMFVNVFGNASFPQDLKAKILQYIIIPSFAVAFERKEGELLIGGPPAPEQDQKENVISVFINKVIDPENPFGTSDAVRILLLQLSCLLVEQAHPHIHVAANKCQGHKLRRLMTFAWPCLLTKNCVDPATKYHGHLLLANIIAKFAIHKRIVLQVFHSLLKAHAAEARTVVRQALEILTPVMPTRMEDDNNMLTHWTKKIIVEEGHTLAQLVHLLQLLVRHYKVYKPVRHHLIQHMVSSIQRLFITPNATLEHKKLAVDLAEVVIRWELERTKEEQKRSGMGDKADVPEASQVPMMRTTTSDSQDFKRAKSFAAMSSKSVVDHLDKSSNKPVDKVHADAIVNFLLRMACQVNESSTAATGSSGELLSRRCVTLLKTALKPDVWPNAELKLAWFDKPLSTVDSPQPNYGNICTALELLAFLLSILRKETILATFRPLQRSIAACLTCQNSKVIRSVHNLLSHLMKIFPTEPTNSNVASKYEELDGLYTAVSKVVIDGLQTYEKSATSSPCALYGTLMILKAACVSNPCYIDRLIATFMRSLQKMQKDHLNPPAGDTSAMSTDLLILSLDLVKNRVGVMGQDMRKTFIGTILVGLIEKSPEVKVLKAITKMVEDWVKCKTPIAVNQSPTIREKSILQVKMMQFIEKRFPTESDLNAQFLELVHYVYSEQTLKGTELQSKLEPAFMAGLRCQQAHIRAKFFKVFDASLRRRLHERLMYIVCSQNWETIGSHFWIKQCIELLLVTASSESTIQCATQNILLPSITSVIEMADTQVRENFALITPIKEEPTVDFHDSRDDEEPLSKTYPQHTVLGLAPTGDSVKFKEETYIDYSLGEDSSKSSLSDGSQGRLASVTTRKNVRLSKQINFLSSLQKQKTINFLAATSQLCHMDTSLAQHLWVQLFPRLWKILTEKQQNVLAAEIMPFLCSGSHVIQRDCHPSAAGTFAEGVSHCQPPIQLKPLLLKYLGKSYNLWHRACLLLEQISFEKTLNTQVKSRVMLVEPLEGDGSVSSQHDALDMIVDMYAQLKEEDLWAGVWQKRAKYPETSAAIALEQQGFFIQAQSLYEEAMTKCRQEMMYALPVSNQSENILWINHWARCAKELNQWDCLLECGNGKEGYDPYMVLENAWRAPNWDLMKVALDQVEQNCPKELAWKVNMYKGYLFICHPQDRHLNMVERQVEIASNLCIREWRRLPHIVSHIHLPILQAAQQISELQDAAQIHQGLLPPNVGRQSSLHDMKAIVKTWRNRLPVLSDDLSHWGEIFAWRQEHYGTIVSSYDPSNNGQLDAQNNNAMLGVHASAQSTIHFGKIARKHGLPTVCLEALGKLHAIPSVPIVDCFQKIRQQVKCYLQLAHVAGKSDPQEAAMALNQGLKAIESTNLKYFSKDMTAEIYAIKGLFLDQMGRTEEANKAFSAAIQLHDTLVKAWALWGDYYESLFTKDKAEPRTMSLGVFALVCYLHSCRHQNESKSRKYLAKVFWLLTYDDENMQLATAVEQNYNGVPPVQWLPWIPQLLTCLVRNEGGILMTVLCQVGRMFPQAVFFPIRTLYLILKIENRERHKGDSSASEPRRTPTPHLPGVSTSGFGSNPPTPSSALPPLAETSPQSSGCNARPPSESSSIRATPPMWRCSRIMNYQRDYHPTTLSSLEGIVEQMVWFRDNVYEEVLRQLRQALAKCYAVAYDNASAVSEASVTPHTLNFVNKLVSTFGIGVENVSSLQQTFPSATSESLARRAQATAQDPVFQKMKGQFTADFDFNAPGAKKLHNLINKLKKWIKILEAKTKLLPKSFLIEEKCRFLSHFSQQTAEIEIPGEFLLLPRPNHYYVRIARFMPRVDIVQKHNTAARRLYIKGHNGKIYPYLVINDACLSDARREERVLQLLRMLNNYLGKQKETLRRFLNFTVPRVLSLSPQMRLVEDNVSSISLLDIYKQCCEKRGTEHDAPLFRYYERLAAVQARGSQASHQVLRDILKDVQNIMVSRTLLKDWAERTYPSATDYWTFRKQFTLQLSLIGFVEYVLHLTRLNPDMMYIHQDSGLMNVAYFRFNVDDITGELDANFGPIRPVPFRLTPNIAEFITTIGICGPMTASMIATARCLVQPNFKVQALFRAILRDEMIGWHKKRQDDTQQSGGVLPDMEGARLIQIVTKAVNAITVRLQSLATFEGADSKVSTLVAAANSPDNLCRMDPVWHPWL